MNTNHGKDEIHIGGGTQYYPEPKVYSVNGENIIVSACIKGSDEPVVAPDYRMTNDGAMFVDILRKGQDGQYENLARCVKNVFKNLGVSVSYGRFILFCKKQNSD